MIKKKLEVGNCRSAGCDPRMCCMLGKRMLSSRINVHLIVMSSTKEAGMCTHDLSNSHNLEQQCGDEKM